MWDPRSELKFSGQRALYPFFKDGQINLFVEQNRGPGIQHIALEVENIVDTVGTLRERDVEFLNTPNIYYDLSRERLSTQGVDTNNIDHDLEVLRPSVSSSMGHQRITTWFRFSSKTRRPPTTCPVLVRSSTSSFSAVGTPRFRRRKSPRALRGHRA